MSQENNTEEKQVKELIVMSEALYVMYTKIGEFDGAITTIRQNILTVCSGLDQLRNQIIAGPEKEGPVEP